MRRTAIITCDVGPATCIEVKDSFICLIKVLVESHMLAYNDLLHSIWFGQKLAWRIAHVYAT